MSLKIDIMGIFINIMPKPKRFHYNPLYYDERKERLEKLKTRACAERSRSAEAEVALQMQSEAEEGSTQQKCGLERGFITESRAKSKKYSLNLEKTSIVRLLIALALIGLLYLVAPEFFTSIWRR